MSATTNTAVSPAFDRERAPDALSGLIIVLPCFDEAENLPDAVRLATDAAERCAAAHEIVVVDDGSSDDTADVAARLVALDPRLRLIVHGENCGYGQALRTGIAAARLPWVLLTDADLQCDCAFRLVRRELVQRLDLRASGALVGTELLVKSRAAGARVADLRQALRGRRIPRVGV